MERYRVHAGATVLTYYCKVQCAIIIHKECKGLQSARELLFWLITAMCCALDDYVQTVQQCKGAAVLAYYCHVLCT